MFNPSHNPNCILKGKEHFISCHGLNPYPVARVQCTTPDPAIQGSNVLLYSGCLSMAMPTDQQPTLIVHIHGLMPVCKKCARCAQTLATSTAPWLTSRLCSVCTSHL